MSLDLSNLSGGSNLFNCSGGGGTGEEDLADGSGVSGRAVSQNPLPAYIGFSAQSFSIPSIACDSDISHASLAERVSRQVNVVILLSYHITFKYRCGPL